MMATKETKTGKALEFLVVDHLENAEGLLVAVNNELMAEVQKAPHPEWASQIDQLGEKARELLRLVRNTRAIKRPG